MTKQVEQFISKLRSENPNKFQAFSNALAHSLTPEELKGILEHAEECDALNAIANEQVEAERLDNIAKELETLAEQVRAGIIPVPTGEVTASIAFEVSN